MSNDLDVSLMIIVALLPLSAGMVVLQVNPYHALAIRGILGAIAALVYAVLGAADVSLTEALMGTMLAITLYAVAVRSSMVLRLGVLQEAIDTLPEDTTSMPLGQLIEQFRAISKKRFMRLELVPFPDEAALEHALAEKSVHAICVPALSKPEKLPLHTSIRLQHLYDMIKTELSASISSLSYDPAQ
jgi:putative multicomponent Na+:H+ antiporter subunit B